MSRSHIEFLKGTVKMLVRSISMRLSDRRRKDRPHMNRDRGETPPAAPPSPPPTGNIHRVQDLVLEEKRFDVEYEVRRTLAEGCFARILLATHRTDGTTVVLKAVHTELTGLKDFLREFHYSYHLSPHPCILSSYGVCFRAEDCWVFAQEHAPLGDLAANVRAGGLPEEACKRVAKQLCSALEFLHSKQLVHRDIKLENVLVFEADMSRVKLCDFGATRREGTLVSKPRCTWLPFVPPELYDTVANERYNCHSASDVWQLAVLVYVCLTGCPPWQNADSISDNAYASFWRWQRRKATKVPAQFRRFGPRLLRMFRRMFEHKAEKRAAITEMNKYLKDPWMEPKLTASQSAGALANHADRRESMHSGSRDADGRSPADENKARLKRLLSSYGLETTVERKVVSKRVWDWVLKCDTEPTEGNGSTHCSTTSLAIPPPTIENKVC